MKFLNKDHTNPEKPNELTTSNYRRISIINWLLSLPMLFLFAWPYVYVCELLNLDIYVTLLGSFLFSVPFTATIVHGHVTLALGTAHRMHYYRWVAQKPYRYAYIFHPDFAKTRYRLALFFISLILLLIVSILQ